jgi:hypothetical protein
MSSDDRSGRIGEQAEQPIAGGDWQCLR